MGLLLWEISAETRANRKTTPDCAVDVKIQSSNFKFELPTIKIVNPLGPKSLYKGMGHIPPSDMPELPPNSAGATPNGSVASPGDLGTLLTQNLAR